VRVKTHAPFQSFKKTSKNFDKSENNSPGPFLKCPLTL
jgi:hypothetical protein